MISRLDQHMEENGEGLFYLLYDGLGSVVAATNANGQVVAQMAYDAFGKVFSQSGQAGDVRYGYTGRPMDKDIGLQYNRARYYEVGTGRWNRADDFRGVLEVPASLQRYVYVHQNPVNSTDPAGYSSSMLDRLMCAYFAGGVTGFLTRFVVHVVAMLAMVVLVWAIIAITATIAAYALTAAGISASVVYTAGGAGGALLGIALKMQVPFNASVQRVGAMSISKSDFWALNFSNISQNSIFPRLFSAIKYEWQSQLTTLTTGVLPRGAEAQISIAAPQFTGRAPYILPGGWVQLVTQSKEVVNQASRSLP